MDSWLLNRTATSLLTVFLLVTVVFFVVRLAPGDPLDRMRYADAGPGERQALREQAGLDRGLGAQYLDWLAGVARGDFGQSLRQQRPVREIVLEAIPPTVALIGSGYVLHLALAFGTALLSVGGRCRRAAGWLQSAGLVLYSVPPFWLGLMLILLLSGRAGWLPAGGMESSDAALMAPLQLLGDRLRHLLLPAATFGLCTYMGTARYLQAALEEALGQDYVLAARSRGLSERRILMRHALRNALLPVITIAGLSLPVLLGGTVVIEVVFGWPGLGRVSVEAIYARDYPVIMATTLLSAVAVVAGSLLADVGYRRADPRLRAGEGRRP